MILNIRGTNASGKTTIVKRLITELNGQPIMGEEFGKERIMGYELDGGVRVVGRYNVGCGGCDTFHTKTIDGVKVKGVDTIEKLVQEWAGTGHHVVFEGLIVTSVFTRWVGLSQRTGGMVWAFLDTPLEECRRRVSERNGGKVLKGTNGVGVDHVKRIFDENLRNYVKAQAAGETALWLDHRYAYPQVREMLRTGKLPESMSPPVPLPDLTPKNKRTRRYANGIELDEKPTSPRTETHPLKMPSF